MAWISFDGMRPVILLLFLATLFSCKKKEAPEPFAKQWLMTVSFKDDYINPQLNAIVFVSDANGAPLADTMVAGNPTVRLYSDKTVRFPLQVTVAKWEPDMHNFLVTLQTWLCVSPAEWTLYGNRLVPGGEVVINLENVPVHSGPILYSAPGYSNLTLASSGQLCPLYQVPGDLYVMLNTAGGPRFNWSYGLVAGTTNTVDLSAMDTAQIHAIALPFAAQDFRVKISGFRDTGNVTALPFVTDEQIGDGSAVSKLHVRYPDSEFEGFQTSVEMIDSWASTTTYTYAGSGRIPDSLFMTNAVLLNSEVTGSKTKFTASGQFTVTSVRWHFQDSQNLAFDWTVSGPDTLTTVSIPALSPAMVNMFPTLSRDSLQLYQYEFTRYPGVQSYSGFLETKFGKAVPGFWNRLESGSARILVN